jgi:hypothetical protein
LTSTWTAIPTRIYLAVQAEVRLGLIPVKSKLRKSSTPYFGFSLGDLEIEEEQKICGFSIDGTWKRKSSRQSAYEEERRRAAAAPGEDI